MDFASLQDLPVRTIRSGGVVDKDLIDPLGLHVREPDISTNTQRLGNAAAVLNHLSTNHQVVGQCVISLHNNLLDGNGSAARWARRE